ncbi:MAG: PadR family transcriptional regulator, regulatory protein PadR [Gaiellaceae bacterium]|jgi:PadR family transcriptional regulator PadR|nr:PadR family transcriptional regulator, regulatory protein PadR [Gaiellaceae bacterium]
MHSMAVAPNRRSQILRGVLDVCVLAVIADGPAYGYEMTKRLVAKGLSPVSEGSIYPILGRFEAQGLVETHREGSNGGPPRKYYTLSESGREALRAWGGEWRDVRTAVDAVLSNQTEVHA